MKVAIVTFELEGLTKNGGIGTAYRRLADQLLDDGHQVTVYFMPFSWDEKFSLDRRRISRELSKLRARGLKIIFPEKQMQVPHVTYDGYHLRRSRQVYEMMKAEKFDFVHAPDSCGLVYVSLMAKRAGLAFAKTKFVLGAHGTVFWTSEANGHFGENSVLLSRLDELSLQAADTVVSPSQYMLDYLATRGVQLPKDSIVIPNINDADKARITLRPKPSRSQGAVGANKSLVFFGRLERRKGFYLFVDALARLLDDDSSVGVDEPLKIVFLGSSALGQLTTPEDFVRTQLSRYAHRLTIEFKTDLTSQQSNDYLLSHRNALVCMPSLMDNSPYVVVEAIERGLDFFATTHGGQAELIDERDHQNLLCAPTVEAVAAMLRRRLSMPPLVARPSKLLRDANKNWSRLHRASSRVKVASSSKKVKPLVSVVIGLKETSDEDDVMMIRSLLAQSYPRLEILISEAADLHLGKTAKRVRTFKPRRDERWVSAAKVAEGRYLLFLDGAMLRDRTTLETWIGAALSCEKTSEKPLAGHHGLVTSVSHDHKRIETTFAMPDDPLRAILGQCLATPYVLWNRETFLKIARARAVDFSNDLTMRSFVTAVVAKGFSISSFPLETIVNRASPTKPRDDQFDQLAALDSLWCDQSPEAARLRVLAAGLAGEIRRLRENYYHSQRQLSSLQQMREEMREAVLRSVQ